MAVAGGNGEKPKSSSLLPGSGLLPWQAEVAVPLRSPWRLLAPGKEEALGRCWGWWVAAWHSPKVEGSVQDPTPSCLTGGSNLGSEEKLSPPPSMGINVSSPRAEPCVHP